MATGTFEPQSVPPSSWMAWLSEALALVTARWLPQAGVALAVMTVFAVLPIWARVLFGPLAVGLVVGASTAVARATDLLLSTAAALRSALPGLAWLGVSILAMQAVAMLFLGVGAAQLKGLSAYQSVEAASDFVGGQWALWFLAVGWTLSMSRDFFLIPLLCCAGFPYWTASDLSERGVQKNWHVHLVRMGAMVVCVAATFVHGLCAILLLPLSGGFLYVAFKHVYLREEPKLDVAPAPAQAAEEVVPLQRVGLDSRGPSLLARANPGPCLHIQPRAVGGAGEEQL